jgi:signal transduction histidine kinase
LKQFAFIIFVLFSLTYCVAQNPTKIDSLLDLSKECSDYEKYYSIQNELGNYYVEIGLYTKGLEIYFMLLKKAELQKDSASIALLYNNIATVYRETGKNDLVLKYASKAVDLSKYVPDLSHRADIHNTLANYYYENYIDSLAIIHFNISHEYRLKAGVKKDIAVSYKNLAGVNYETGNTKLAIQYVHTSLTIRKEIDDRQGLISSYLCLGEIYYFEQILDSSLYYFNECIFLVDSTTSPFIIKKIYDGISLVYSELGDFKNAYKYLKQLIEINDSIFNIENNKQITEFNEIYNTEKKERDLLFKNYELKQQKDKNLLNIIIFSAIGVLLILLFVLIFLKIRHKQKSLLEKEKIKQDKLRFKAAIESEEKERIRIAKELHDGLGQLLSTAKLNLSGLDGSIDKDDEKLLTNSITILDDAVNEVRSISHNLMPTALINYDLIRAIDSLCEKINNSAQINIEFNHSEFNHSLNKETEITLYRIIQEIVNNMIKHSGTNKIDILLVTNNNSINLTIQDFGKGFDTDIIKEDKGIGWQNIFSRVSMLNGNIDIISKKEKGTKITVTFNI